MRARTLFTTMAVTVVAALGLAAFALAGNQATMPSVKFTTPKANAVTGSKVTFTVKLTNFRIDAKNVGKANRAGRGHLHFAMDNGKYDYAKYSGANGKLAAQLGIAGKYSPAVLPTITYRNLPQGKHTLTLFLVNNDHSNNSAKATLRFTVK